MGEMKADILQEREQNSTNGLALVGSKRLLEILFPNENDRPGTRWLDELRYRNQVRYLKRGGFVWFNPAQVREDFERFLVEASGSR